MLRGGLRRSVSLVTHSRKSFSSASAAGGRTFEYFENLEKREDGVAIVRLNGPGLFASSACFFSPSLSPFPSLYILFWLVDIYAVFPLSLL